MHSDCISAVFKFILKEDPRPLELNLDVSLSEGSSRI